MKPVRTAHLSLLLALAGGVCAAHETVTVGPGQKLWEDHLEAGFYRGQPFTLGPDTTFRIDGGRFGTVGNTTRPFDFQGSHVEIVNDGGILTLAWNAANVLLDVHSGKLKYDVKVHDGSVANIHDGQIDGSLCVENATMSVRGGSFTRNSAASARHGGTLNLLGGTLPERIIGVAGHINLNGGEPNGDTYVGLFSGATCSLANAELDVTLEARDGSAARVSAGNVSIQSAERAEIRVSGGTMSGQGNIEWATILLSGGRLLHSFAIRDSLLVQTGGRIDSGLRASRSELRIYGGEIGEGLDVDRGSIVHIFVKDLRLDGEPIALRRGQSVSIPDRVGTILEATLARGASAAFHLNDRRTDGQDHFDPSAKVIVTRLGCPADLTTTGVSPESPLHGLPDGDTDFSDLLFFVERWRQDEETQSGSASDVTTTGAPPGHPSSGKPDGAIDLADLIYFINEWVNGANLCPPGA